MSKRKFREFHDDEVCTNSLSNGVQGTQQERLQSVLDHSKKVLSRALRIARGIERQKLGRRQKTAKESDVAEESARLNAEVAALKVGALWQLPIHMVIINRRNLTYLPKPSSTSTSRW